MGVNEDAQSTSVFNTTTVYDVSHLTETAIFGAMLCFKEIQRDFLPKNWWRQRITCL